MKRATGSVSNSVLCLECQTPDQEKVSFFVNLNIISAATTDDSSKPGKQNSIFSSKKILTPA